MGPCNGRRGAHEHQHWFYEQIHARGEQRKNSSLYAKQIYKVRFVVDKFLQTHA